jgi:hypothetical protein|tara:strand:- start:454 stop:645 length:192 start_codon:yes stop_codon:yes gene_type:complete
LEKASLTPCSSGNEVISAVLYTMWAGGHIEHTIAAIMMLAAAIWSTIFVVAIISWKRSKKRKG